MYAQHCHLAGVPKARPVGLILAAMLSGHCLEAGEPSPIPEAPAPLYDDWRIFTVADGLPHNHVRAVLVTGSEVWVGTNAGLARTTDDGWQSWTVEDGLPSPMVMSMARDPETRDLWLGTWGGGLVRFTGGRFDCFDQRNSGLAGDLVFDVACSGGRVWAATNGGLSSFDVHRDDWELHFERGADATADNITGLIADGDQLFAVAWCRRVWLLEPATDRWVPQTLAVADSGALGVDAAEVAGTHGPVLAAAAKSGALYWATPERLFRRDASGHVVGTDIPRSQSGDAARTHMVRCLSIDEEGTAWLGADGSLAASADGGATWATYRRRYDAADDDRSPSRAGRGAHADANATRVDAHSDSTCGVVSVEQDGRLLMRRALPSLLPDNRVRCIALGENEIWVGSVAGLARGRRAARPDTTASTGDGTPDIGRGDCREQQSVADSVQSPAGGPQIRVVTVAVLGPGNRRMFLPGAAGAESSNTAQPDLLSVKLAIEQANARGGYRGKVPFSVRSGPRGYNRYGWGMVEDDLASYADDPTVCGVIAHLMPGDVVASAVVLQSELPVVNVATHAPTIDETINPWIVRCGVPGEGGNNAPVDASVEKEFVETYSARFKQTPRPGAYASFRAARRLIEAVNVAGRGMTFPDRETVRRTLRAQCAQAGSPQ